MAIQPKKVTRATGATADTLRELRVPSSSIAMNRRWPAEWEPQDAVWFAWPHRKATWPRHFKPIPAAFAAIVNAASEYTTVRVLAPSGKLAKDAKRHLSDTVELVDIATNDCWIRDYGPTFVQDGGDVIGIDWQFNSWGGKYSPWDADAAASGQICRIAGLRNEVSKLTLEGGAIEGDGNGRLLTTPDCIQTANRNRGWNRERISKELHKRLGVTEIVWIDGGGLEGDDTDGHIDQLARFIDPTNVVAAVSSAPDDVNSLGLTRNFAQLQAWAEQTSPVVSIHALPTPPPRSISGQRVPESYCNFLMLGSSVLFMPTFANRKSDAKAKGILRELCPGRKVLGVDASDFILGRGAWHCASQQQPSRRVPS